MTATTAAEATAVQTAESIFIRVPARDIPGEGGATIHVPAYLTGQYLTSRNAAGQLVVTADGVPITDISYDDALVEFGAAGLPIITESQYLSLAMDIASVAANWTSGVVGEGKLKQGLRKWTVRSAQPGTYVSPDADEDRWFTLSNGERICDGSGHLFTWVRDNVQGDERGIVARAFAPDSPSITCAVAPSMKKGAGWQPDAGDDWSGAALIRGGFFDSGDHAGLFGLDGGWPVGAYGDVGVRCTKPE